MKKLENMIEVTYEAFVGGPLRCETVGYVEPDRLIECDSKEGQALETSAENEEVICFEDDEDEATSDWKRGKIPPLKYGYLYVSTGDNGYYVSKEDIYTEVWREKSFFSGWGWRYPMGGSASARKPEAQFEEKLLVKNCWG